jgi:hypothetical protein
MADNDFPAVHGSPVWNIEALANPAALEHIRIRDELMR